MDPGSPGVVIGLSVLASEVFVSIVTNIFIASTIFCDSYRKKKVNSKHKIQLALKVSSTIFMTVLPYNEFSNILQPDPSKISHLSPSFTVVVVYFMFSCSWLIAFQCFYYFIKIVNFQSVFIHWVKARIDSIVSWQIVVVEVLSPSISLLHLFTCEMAHVSFTNSSYISSANWTPQQMIVEDHVSLFLLVMISAQHVFSVIVNLITAAFLRCHMKKMKDNNTSGEVQQYKHAVQIMLRILLFYFVFYFMMFLYYFSVFALYSIGYWINVILVFSFIPAINVLQIQCSTDLRATWKEMTSYFILCREPNTH